MSKAVPRTGDALERLRDQRQQIDDLFESLATHRLAADASAGETARIASLIFTLLRVHARLESELLLPALQRETDNEPALAEAAARRKATLEAIERVEALAVGDPLHATSMAWVHECAGRWFDADEAVFALAQRTAVDLALLDHEMAARQESLLTAGREL